MQKQKYIPALRFPEFKSEWERKKVGELCDCIVPGRNKPTDFDGEIPWITTPDIEHNGIITFSKKGLNISEEQAKKIGSKIVPKNSIIISCVGDLGLSAIAGKKIVINQQLHAFLPKEQIEYGFLLYQLNSQKKYMEMVATKTAVPYMNKDNCNSIPISFPALPEQKRIASFFTALDQKITQLKLKKTLLEQYKKGVMQKLFSQELRFKDDKGKEFPKWERKNGDDLFDSVSNKIHNSDLPILAISQEFGAVPRELINYQISVTERSIEGYKVVEIGDFIISLRSFQGGIEFSNYKGICSPAYIILRSKIKINTVFFKYYFKTDSYIQKLGKKLEGIRDGKMISYKYFSEIALPYPTLSEQTKIANFLSAIDEKISRTETQIRQTEQYKKGLLQKMFI